MKVCVKDNQRCPYLEWNYNGWWCTKCKQYKSDNEVTKPCPAECEGCLNRKS